MMGSLEDVVPVFFDEIDLDEGNVEEATGLFSVFSVFISRTEAKLVLAVPIPHEGSNDVITYVHIKSIFKPGQPEKIHVNQIRSSAVQENLVDKINEKIATKLKISL